MQEKKINMKSFIIIILLFIIVVMIDTNWQKSKELNEKQKKIDEIEIQINSLWDNVQQLQNEYSKIVDKLYNPEVNKVDQ